MGFPRRVLAVHSPGLCGTAIGSDNARPEARRCRAFTAYIGLWGWGGQLSTQVATLQRLVYPKQKSYGVTIL